MTTTTRSTPSFTVHSATATARAVFLAALCAFIVTAFLIDVQRGASGGSGQESAELRT
jgi:hypothetical protein